MAEQTGQLDDDQDQADARHESGNNGVGHQRDITPQLEYPERHLKGTGEHHRGEGHRHGVLRDDTGSRIGRHQRNDHRGEHHGHGARRLGDQRRRATEQRGEQPNQNGAVEARFRTRAGGDPEGECHRQGDDGGCNAAEEVAL